MYDDDVEIGKIIDVEICMKMMEMIDMEIFMMMMCH